MAEKEQPSGDVPAHVPGHLVRDVDYFAVPGIEHDPHEAWMTIRASAPPIFYTPRNGGHWIVTGFEDIRDILRDHDRFSSYPPGIPSTLVLGPYPQPPVGADPPEHTPFRAMLQPAFSPRAILAMEDYVRGLTRDLIASFIDRGSCEFVDAFAHRMPIGVFLRLMGLPESDRERLLEHANQRMRGATEADRIGGAVALASYAEEKLRERRAYPRADLLSSIAALEINGEPADYGQIRTLVMTLLLAGLDTVVNTLSFVARFLAAHPAHRESLVAQLDDEQMLMRATEEFLRRFGVPNIARSARVDQEFNGVRMRAGDPVLSVISMSGLDARKYPDPLAVDFSRELGLQVNFGAGVHRCVGAHLARLEIRVFLEEWLRRIPDFALDPNDSPIGIGGAVLGLGRLPLRWGAQS